MAALFFEFCGWVPAYFESAVPPEKAEPGALPEPPGGEPVVSQDCIGWPVVCAGPDPGLLGGVVAVVVGLWLAPGPPLGGAALVTVGASAIAPAAIRSLRL